jgi:hypothetical protein
MSTKRSKVADTKEIQADACAARLKLYAPYVIVIEGHCRDNATNPVNGGAFVSLHAAIRTLILLVTT